MRSSSITHTILWLTILVLGVTLGNGLALAENTDPGNNDSQYAYGENVGWLNVEPMGDGGPGVKVEDSKLTGYIWAENIGWVGLSCENTSSCSTVNYGVINDGIGNLSGYGWSENVGWISFSCKNTGSCDTVRYGVIIDPATGVFSGKAWGENLGWISFNSTGTVTFDVKTAWWDNVLPGDVDDNTIVDLSDAIMALQICTGFTPQSIVHKLADVNNDSKIGVEEVDYILQKISGLR